MKHQHYIVVSVIRGKSSKCDMGKTGGAVSSITVTSIFLGQYDPHIAQCQWLIHSIQAQA